jgi:hypothetical protein
MYTFCFTTTMRVRSGWSSGGMISASIAGQPSCDTGSCFSSRPDTALLPDANALRIASST